MRDPAAPQPRLSSARAFVGRYECPLSPSIWFLAWYLLSIQQPWGNVATPHWCKVLWMRAPLWQHNGAPEVPCGRSSRPPSKKTADRDPMRDERSPLSAQRPMVNGKARQCIAARAGRSCPVGVNRDRGGRSRTIAHVRFTPKAEQQRSVSVFPLSAN